MTDAPHLTDSDAPADDEGFFELPSDKPAERSVLGAMILDPRKIPTIVTILTAEDFWFPEHVAIWEAIVTVWRSDTPVEALSVMREIERTGMVRRAGGPTSVIDVISQTVTAANGDYYADLVQRAAARRRMISAGIKLGQLGHSAEGDLGEMVAEARELVDGIYTGHTRKVRAVGETLLDVAATLDKKPIYFPTPWASLDKLIGGFAPAGFYVFGARPGSGKSIALLQSAVVLAHRGTVAVSQLEMTEQEMQLRLISQNGPVHMTTLRDHALTDMDWRRVNDARVAVQDAPIFIDDTPNVTLADIEAHVRSVAQRGPLAGVLVDYLQLINHGGTDRDRRVAVDRTAQGLKELAKRYRVPVIAAAQLSRAGAKRGLPTLEDLREAGGIENAADAVVLFSRDAEKDPYSCDAIVAKNRHGDQGKFSLRWEGHFARMVGKTWQDTTTFWEESNASE